MRISKDQNVVPSSPPPRKITGVILHPPLPIMATPLQRPLSSVPKIQVYEKVTDSTESVNTLQTYRGAYRDLSIHVTLHESEKVLPKGKH